MTRPGPALRRTAALALLAVVLAGVAAVTAVPLADAYQQRRDALAALADRLRGYQRIEAERADSERRLESIEKRLDLEGLAFEGDNAARAAGALQQRLSELVTSAGGTLQSIQVLPAAEEQGFFKLVARTQLTATVETLPAVLYALESSVPLLVLEKISITARSRRPIRSGITPPPTLTVRIEAAGFLDTDAPRDGG